MIGHNQIDNIFNSVMCVVLKMTMRPNGKTPKFDHFIHQYLIIVVIVTVVIADNKTMFKCPGPSQWKFRAKSECNDTDKYICLFDENGQKDEEFCGSWPDFENPGYKQILLGGTTVKPCSEDRYQPFIFWTNGSSKCVFKKESCNQEGQVIHSNGTLQTNRICRCDYTHNYDYVIQPKNGCFCLPSEEDCSCYVKSCQSGYVLSRDYECLKESKLKYNCPEIYRDLTDNEIRRTTIISLVEHVTQTGGFKWSALIVTFVCITAVLVFFVVYRRRKNRNHFGVSSKSKHVQKEEFIHYITQKNEAACMIPCHVLDLQEKEIMKWRERHMLFEETTASKNLLDEMKTHGFVILSGPPGCGKSAIAYNSAFMLERTAKFTILPISSPEEIRKYLSPETKQIFVIDDPVGRYAVDDTSIRRWKNEENFINEIFTNSLNTKLILTCRSYIYKSGFSRLLHISPMHFDLLSSDLKLSIGERTKLCKIYNLPDVNKDTIMMYDFFPLLCAMYSTLEDTNMFFVNPYKILTEEIGNIKENSDIAFLAIALLVVQDDNIAKQSLSLENETTKELLNDLCNECGFKYFPSTTVILAALNHLIGTYVKNTDVGFACIHDTLFQNLSFIVGSSIIHCLIKYGNSKFLSNRLLLTSLQQQHHELVIMVKPEQEEIYFQRLLLDIRKGYHSHVFTGIQMDFSRFRTKLLTFLESLKTGDLTCDQNDSTPLHVVSEKGYDDLVFKLYQLRKDHINLQDKNKRTPLFMACLGRHDKVIQTLLPLDNSSLHVANDDDLTPFDVASINDDVSTMNIFLKNDAKVNRKDEKMKRTALQRACAKGSYNAVTFLLKRKVDVQHKDKDGLRAIHIACLKGHLEIVELLLKHDKSMINECDDDGRTPLLIACKSNRQDIVKLLIENNANVNRTDLKRISPLYSACQIGNDTIVGFLLDKSVKVNIRSENGYSPLHAASIKGSLSCVGILLDKHVDIDLATEQGSTAFFLSCSKGHLDICKLLHFSGSNVNVFDKSANTPLHVACRENHERIVRFLIDHDANVNAVNTSKESPLFIACGKECVDVVQLLIDNHADVNIHNIKGNSPLHVACIKGNKTIVQLLLNQKANIQKRNKVGKTPFDIVQEKKNDTIVDMFNSHLET